MSVPNTRVPRLLRIRFCGALVGVFALLLGDVSILAQNSPAMTEEYQQAVAAMRAGRLDEAEASFQKVVKMNPNLPEGFFNLGLVLEQQRKYDEAVASFEKSLALRPRMRGANLFLGLAEYRSNHLEKAVTALKKEAAAYPKDAAAWMWIGVVRLAQDQPEEAAEALDKAAKLDPKNIDILYHRGRAHLLVSNDSYTEMFRIDPKSWRVHQVLAQTNAESEHHEDAVAEYLAAIQLAPTQPGLHEELGSEYRILVKIPEAEAAFRRELEINPDNVTAEYKLGVIAVEQGDGAEGKKLIEEALKVTPGLLNADYNLGRAEMKLGNDAAAAEHFKLATGGNSEPDIVEQSWYQLGTVLRRMHHPEEAQQAFAMFEKLKDQELESTQKKLKHFQVQKDSDAVAPAPSTEHPQN